jgi:hypothetical protein
MGFYPQPIKGRCLFRKLAKIPHFLLLTAVIALSIPRASTLLTASHAWKGNGSGFMIRDSSFMVYGFRVKGLGFRV